MRCNTDRNHLLVITLFITTTDIYISRGSHTETKALLHKSSLYTERITSVINLKNNTYITDALIKIGDSNISVTFKTMHTYMNLDSQTQVGMF